MDIKSLAACILGVGIALCFPTGARAHEFWLSPSTFQMSAPGDVELSVNVGDGADIAHWGMRRQRVVGLRAFGADGVIDHQRQVQDGAQSIRLPMERGAYVVALETNHAFLELPADEFNAYVEHEGLTPILQDRTSRDALGAPGREMYSRRAKALIRVGGGADDVFTRPIGMSLEIVPERSPYRLRRGEALPIRVYFHGEPLVGALVQLGRLDRPSDPAVTATTDVEGRARFSLTREGNWRLSVIWSEPLEQRERADYDTTFSSLTFGY